MGMFNQQEIGWKASIYGACGRIWQVTAAPIGVIRQRGWPWEGIRGGVGRRRFIDGYAEMVSMEY